MAGVFGFFVAGFPGAVAAVCLAKITDDLIQQKSPGQLLVRSFSMNDSIKEEILGFQTFSAPLIVNCSRALNPIVDVANVVVTPLRPLGIQYLQRAEHHFAVVQTASHWYLLQKCHNGDIQFTRCSSLESCLQTGIEWGGSNADISSAELMESFDIPSYTVQLGDVWEWVRQQEPTYVLKWANCQHFVSSLRKRVKHLIESRM